MGDLVFFQIVERTEAKQMICQLEWRYGTKLLNQQPISRKKWGRIDCRVVKERKGEYNVDIPANKLELGRKISPKFQIIMDATQIGFSERSMNEQKYCSSLSN